jgi:hypothetical protein
MSVIHDVVPPTINHFTDDPELPALNFTFNNNQVAVTPLFLGADPAEYPLLEHAGLRILGQEEDLGIRLINGLSAQQRKKATRDTAAPQDIITAAESGKRLIAYWGIKASELSQEQQRLLTLIIREFVFNLEHEKSLLEYDKIVKAGISNVYFGWIGSYKETQPHYYVLNGPTFLIEFDNHNNHIHAIWREKGNDFGEDILKEHYRQSLHK